MPFALEIVTPERLAWKGEASALVLPTIDGEVGILPKHEPYVTVLGHGEGRITALDGAVEQRHVEGRGEEAIEAGLHGWQSPEEDQDRQQDPGHPGLGRGCPRGGHRRGRGGGVRAVLNFRGPPEFHQHDERPDRDHGADGWNGSAGSCHPRASCFGD